MPGRRPEQTLPTSTMVPSAIRRDAVNRMISRAACVAVVAVATLLGACDSSDSGPPVPKEDFPRLLADALCNNIGPCCEQAGYPHDKAVCHTAAETELRAEMERTRPANVVYDANAARACLDAYTAVVTSCQPENALGDACRYIFAGTVSSGQPCASTEECTPGTSCQRPADAGALQCGTSPTQVHGTQGQSCRSTCTDGAGSTTCSGSGGPGQGTPGTASCFTNDGLYCDSMYICAVMPALSQPCTATTPCAGEAFCDSGVCAAKRTSGSCGQLNDGCAATAYCDTATRQCQLRKSTGAACTTSSECPTTDRCRLATCRTRTIATASSCLGNL